MPEYILGVDGGQTSTKVLIATTDGELVWSARTASATPRPGKDLVLDAERRLMQTLQQALAGGPWQHATYKMAVLGMSGAEPGSPLVEAYQRAAEGAVRAQRYLVVHDAITNLMGASAGQAGIVVVAGGGAAALGRTKDGRTWTSGGWGYAIGDEGSGYNVGRGAINAVFRAADGRAPQTRLTSRVLQRLRASSLVELKYAIFRGQVSFSDIAGLPPLVAQVAAEGDAPAQSILEGGGRDLATTAIAVAQKLGMTAGAVDIYPTGGLFQEQRYLLPAFSQTIRAALPAARIRPPAFEPVVGTLILAWSELGHELDPDRLDRLAKSLGHYSVS